MLRLRDSCIPQLQARSYWQYFVLAALFLFILSLVLFLSLSLSSVPIWVPSEGRPGVNWV